MKKIKPKTKPKPKTKKVSLRDFIINHVRHIRVCGYLTNFKFENIYPLKKPGNMEIKMDYDYLGFDLGYDEKLNKKRYKEKRYDVIIASLCHEMAHIATGEITEMCRIDEKPAKVKHYEERMTELTSRWLHDSYIQFMIYNKIKESTGKIKN